MGTLRTTNIQHADAAAAGMILAADGTVSGLRATQNTQSGVAYSLASTDSGRTVTLSNAAAVTVTLPAQATVAWNVGETLSLLNIGVGTVTITPAATVTINGTPLTLTTSREGTLIRTAVNTWTFIPTGGDRPGLLLISKQTVSAASGVIFNNVFTSTFRNYRIIMSNRTQTTSGDSLMRLRAGGTDNSSSLYNTLGVSNSISTGPSRFAVIDNTSINVGQMSSMTGFTIMDIFGPQLNTITNYSWQAQGNEISISSQGRHNFVGVFDGFNLFPPSGTTSADIYVYGYSE